jgi:hypothetical protein
LKEERADVVVQVAAMALSSELLGLRDEHSCHDAADVPGTQFIYTRPVKEE